MIIFMQDLVQKRVYRYIITSKPTTPFNDKFVTYIKNR